MRTKALILGLAMLAACNTANPDKDKDNEDDGTTPQPAVPTVTTPDFAYGADVSWVSEMEKGGRSFRKQDGSSADIFEVLADVGINSIRLRVWVNPTGGWSGKDDVAALATRATKAGMATMIDFHYSDFFADPGRQTFPAAWNADIADVTKTMARVKDHTTEVLNALKAAGVSPSWIQIGNETTGGMLWPLGQLYDGNGDIEGGWARFAQLYGAGYAAAKTVFPSAVVMPHIDNAYKDNVWWFKKLQEQGQKFDAIALSHYPQNSGNGTPEACNNSAVSQIRLLYSTFRVPVYVAEVGVKVKSEAASATLLKSFMDAVKTVQGCKGVFYWEPEVDGSWKPAVYNGLGWGAYDMGAFTTDGRPTSIMNAFKH